MPSLVALNQDDAAASVGISSRTFQRWMNDGCPGSDRRYVISEIVQWARENRWGDDDGALIDSVDGSSDTKERLLKARAEKVENEVRLQKFLLDERRQNLVDSKRIESILMRSSAVIKERLGQLERDYGSDALSIVLEAFDELDKLLESGELDTRDETDQP